MITLLFAIHLCFTSPGGVQCENWTETATTTSQWQFVVYGGSTNKWLHFDNPNEVSTTNGVSAATACPQ